MPPSRFGQVLHWNSPAWRDSSLLTLKLFRYAFVVLGVLGAGLGSACLPVWQSPSLCMKAFDGVNAGVDDGPHLIAGEGDNAARLYKSSLSMAYRPRRAASSAGMRRHNGVHLACMGHFKACVQDAHPSACH